MQGQGNESDKAGRSSEWLKEEAPNSDDPPSLVAGGFIQLEHNWPCMLCRWLLALQPIPVLWARESGFSLFFLRQFFFLKKGKCVPVLLLLNLNGTVPDQHVCIIQIRWGSCRGPGSTGGA